MNSLMKFEFMLCFRLQPIECRALCSAHYFDCINGIQSDLYQALVKFFFHLPVLAVVGKRLSNEIILDMEHFIHVEF